MAEQTPQQSAANSAGTLTTLLSVEGMTCGNCARHVSDAIQTVPGASVAAVDPDSAQATVRWKDGNQRDIPALLKALEKAGYPAIEKPTVQRDPSRTNTLLNVEGMTCANCVRHVTQAIQGYPGVKSAMVSLETRQANVRWEEKAPEDISPLLKTLSDEGYPSTEITADSVQSGHRILSGWTLNLLLGIPVTLFFIIGEWALGLGMSRSFQWVGFFLATVVQVFAGARFYKGAWAQLKVGQSNMDTLVALGSSTAYLYSVWALLFGHGGHVYFMESAAIITLISLGHWFEARVAVRASSALRNLLDLAPAMARRVTPDGPARDVPVADLKPGDLYEVRPGDKVPTDGVVVEGTSSADEAMLTGESAAVEKAAGATLYGGTVNVDGRLVARVTAVGEETALSHIVAAVQRAQSSRANIQRIGDRVSSVFVPIVVCIALAAALWWGLAPASAEAAHHYLAQFLWKGHLPFGSVATPFIIAAAILIIACPCAMGLATPAAIMAGSNAAAQRGILIRDGVALEKAGTVTAILFDKTGTLTEGKPHLAQTWASPGTTTEEAVRHAAGLAQRSTHPLSRAIAAASPNAPGAADISELRGAGMQAARDNTISRLGSLRWLADNGVALAGGESFSNEWTAKGATVVGLAQDKQLLALFAVRDSLRSRSAETVQHLRKLGLRVYMVTGDNARTAQAIALEAGIETSNVFAEVRPEEKAGLVKRLQEKGERIAFVGDGINDAPALEQSDMGIAVSRASDVAREAADIILLRSGIEAVPESLGLARATLRTIKQNFFWAFFYNALGVPLAALGFMSPVLCAAAMGLSDVVVIGNALRLRRWKSH